VPALQHVLGIAHHDQGGGNIGSDVDAGEDRDPGEPCHPALHPGDASPILWWCEMPCPVVLCAGDGLHGGHLGEGSDLAEHTGEDDEEAPDHCSWSAVVEGQADVAMSRCKQVDGYCGGGWGGRT